MALIPHHCQWDSQCPKAEGEAFRRPIGWPISNAGCRVSGKEQSWERKLPALSDRRRGSREPSLGKGGPGLAFDHLGCLTPSEKFPVESLENKHEQKNTEIAQNYGARIIYYLNWGISAMRGHCEWQQEMPGLNHGWQRQVEHPGTLLSCCSRGDHRRCSGVCAETWLWGFDAASA